MITKCPYSLQKLEEVLHKDFENNNPVEINIDETKRQVTFKFKNQTWTQVLSFENLNVRKITGQKPIDLFMKEYKKDHKIVGCGLPNIPSMLESWCIEFNKNHQ